MSKHFNIPIFVPHYGCPFSCVFCNQNAITGKDCETEISEAEDIICRQLSTIEGSDIEIAFFGGSFTAIPKNIMMQYLKTGKKYIDSGRVRGIRISTRPDFIDRNVLDILKSSGVTTIELGAQSFCDDVLKKSGRGHNADDTRRAAKLINSYGCFDLGIQLMTGLPGDSRAISINSAKEAAALNPAQVRIYPTLVIRGTAMEKMFLRQTYRPQTLDETVECVGEMLDIFEKNNIPVIRVGLSSIDDMRKNDSIVAGPVHPALRELCEGAKYLSVMEKAVEQYEKKPSFITVFAPSSEFSKISGHKKCNKVILYKKYGAILKLQEAEKFSVKVE